MSVDSSGTPDPVARHREFIFEVYGGAIGRSAPEVPTPALLLDLEVAKRNIARMAAALRDLNTAIRPHIKVHKSIELARLQVDAGAAGLSTATVWEACALAWGRPRRPIRCKHGCAAPENPRVWRSWPADHRVLVAVDDAANAAELSAAARAAGRELGVLIEVDTGMDRAGVDTVEEALALAKQVVAYDHLRLEGVTGYEGHCSLEPDEAAPHHQATCGDGPVPRGRRPAGVPGLSLPDPLGRRYGNVEAVRASVRASPRSRPVLTSVMDNFHGRMVAGVRARLDGGHDRDQPASGPIDRRRR